jgi:hypothetical protein
MKGTFIACVILIFPLPIAASSHEDTRQKLISMRGPIESILKSVVLRESPAMEFAKGKTYRRFIKDTPVLVHHNVGNWHEFGNYIGIYFEAIACAKVTNMHYMSAKTW